MKGESFGKNLICIDNTAHINRVVYGTPLLSFYRFSKPLTQQTTLIAYADSNGDPKCEEYNQSVIQNLVIQETGDFKAICKCGLIELAKRRLATYEEMNKKYDLHLPTDGRGLTPLNQDSSTIILCSDFFGFSPNFFNMARVGPFGSEYLIRPLDNIFCVYVEERNPLDVSIFPPWVKLTLINSGNPYSLSRYQDQYGFFSRKEPHTFHFNLQFPNGESHHFTVPLATDPNIWPFPYDICLKDLKSRPSLVPTYVLIESEEKYPQIDTNKYQLTIPQDAQLAAKGYFTLHVDKTSPPFGMVDFRRFELILSAWNFPFFDTTPNNNLVLQYLKEIPLAYFIPAQLYLSKRGYDVARADPGKKYEFYQERKDFFNAEKKDSSKQEKYDRRTSFNSIRFATKFSGQINLKSYGTYKCVDNLDTADSESWSSLNTLVFRKVEENFQWKVDAPISMDRILELMPHEVQKPIMALSEESSDNPDDVKAQKTVDTKLDTSYVTLDRLVVLLRDKDTEAISKILESLSTGSIQQYNFTKYFLRKAVDRYQLRGVLDNKVIESFN